MKYLKYLHYVIRHKWFVFLACRKAGLYWLGIVHDVSKFLPSEFFPYARYFYGKYPSLKDIHGDARNRISKWAEDVDRDFDMAWLLHQKRNKHHWQWWLLPEDEGGVKVLPMQPKYRQEMICDWFGASAAQGHGRDLSSVKSWYDKNAGKMQLCEYTRTWIEEELKGIKAFHEAGMKEA